MASIAAGQTVSFNINTSQTEAISPYIYGINGTSLGNYNDPTFERTGGNRITAYNWTNNYSNAGSDYFYENDNFYSSSTSAGAGMAAAINPAMSAVPGIVVGVPINGYVSKDDLGGSQDVRYYPGTTTFDPNWLSDRFVPEMPSKSLAGAGAFTLTPSPSSSVVYEDEFVNWVKTQYPRRIHDQYHDAYLVRTGQRAGPVGLDARRNPPDRSRFGIRPRTRWALPNPYLCRVDRQEHVAYAMAIKAVAPNAKIFGPVSYGWEGYTTLQDAPDSGTDGDFSDVLPEPDGGRQPGRRPAWSMLDLHWYTEVDGYLGQNTDHYRGHGLQRGHVDGGCEIRAQSRPHDPCGVRLDHRTSRTPHVPTNRPI